MGSEDLVYFDNFHTDSLGDNLAFQFDDLYLRVGDNDNDYLAGSENNDLIIGGAGNDTINGWADNDTLNGGAGNDSLFGGFGFDTAVYQINGITQGINIGGANAGSFDVTDSFGDVDNLAAVENITATNNVDTVRVFGGFGGHISQLNVDALAGNDTFTMADGDFYIDSNDNIQTSYVSNYTNFERFEIESGAKIYSSALGNQYYLEDDKWEASYIHLNEPNGLNIDFASGLVSGASGTDTFHKLNGSLSGLNFIEVDGTAGNDEFALNIANADYRISGYGGNDIIEVSDGYSNLFVYEYVSGVDTIRGDVEGLNLKLPSSLDGAQLTGQYINVVEDSFTEIFDPPIDENTPPALNHTIKEYRFIWHWRSFCLVFSFSGWIALGERRENTIGI